MSSWSPVVPPSGSAAGVWAVVPPSAGSAAPFSSRLLSASLVGLPGGVSGGMYLTTHSVSAVSSIPSNGVPRWKVERSEVTFSCRALARARVNGPLGGLGAMEEEVSVGRPVSFPV